MERAGAIGSDFVRQQEQLCRNIDSHTTAMTAHLQKQIELLREEKKALEQKLVQAQEETARFGQQLVGSVSSFVQNFVAANAATSTSLIGHIHKSMDSRADSMQGLAEHGRQWSASMMAQQMAVSAEQSTAVQDFAGLIAAKTDSIAKSTQQGSSVLLAGCAKSHDVVVSVHREHVARVESLSHAYGRTLANLDGTRVEATKAMLNVRETHDQASRNMLECVMSLRGECVSTGQEIREKVGL